MRMENRDIAILTIIGIYLGIAIYLIFKWEVK